MTTDHLEAPPLTGGGHAAILPVQGLATYHKNPRTGNVAAIAASLKAQAQYRPIVVNAGTMTGRKREVLAGNHTLLAARQLGWSAIQCWVIDVDDEAAARIVLADNRTADLGGYDEQVLTELLSDLGDLTGTGYTDEELGKMIAGGVETPGSADEFVDKPGVDIENQYGVIVICTTEAEQAMVYDELAGKGREVRVVTV